MECRRGLVVALGILSGTAGCVTGPTLPVTATGRQAAVDIRPEADLPNRKPKPSTCVAFGSFHEKAAQNPKLSAADQERERDQARKAYQQALQLDPNDLTALSSLARLYAGMGDRERTTQTYQRALKAHPKEPSLWHDLGLYHARAKEWDPALSNLYQAVQLDPENRPFAHDYGFCLARAGRNEESYKVLARLDGDAGAYYTLARMLNHLGQKEQSRQHLHYALQLKPDMKEAKEMMASLENAQAAVAPAAAESYLSQLPQTGNEIRTQN